MLHEHAQKKLLEFVEKKNLEVRRCLSKTFGGISRSVLERFQNKLLLVSVPKKNFKRFFEDYFGHLGKDARNSSRFRAGRKSL